MARDVKEKEKEKEVIPWWEQPSGLDGAFDGFKKLGNAIKHLFVGYNKEEEKEIIKQHELAQGNSWAWLPMVIVGVLFFFIITD